MLDRSSDLPLTFLATVARASAAIGDWPAVHMHLPALRDEIGRESPCVQIIIRSFEAQLALQEERIGEALTTLLSA